MGDGSAQRRQPTPPHGDGIAIRRRVDALRQAAISAGPEVAPAQPLRHFEAEIDEPRPQRLDPLGNGDRQRAIHPVPGGDPGAMQGAWIDMRVTPGLDTLRLG